MLIGGTGAKNEILRTCSIHDLTKNSWIVGLPQMNKCRTGASSCFLKGIVYVFAGFTGYASKDGLSNSIEKIPEQSLVPGSKAVWDLIFVALDVLTPCVSLAVAPLNNNEIVILGGWNNGANTALGDVVIYDTKTKECHKSFSGELKFCTYSNQTV